MHLLSSPAAAAILSGSGEQDCVAFLCQVPGCGDELGNLNSQAWLSQYLNSHDHPAGGSG